MKISEFLKRSRQRLIVSLPDETLGAIAKRMYAHNIGAVAVCEFGTRMIGIISERDLVRAFARGDWNELRYIRARDVMTSRVVACGPSDTMKRAHELMRTNHFRHLPIVKDRRILGMLSMRDVLALRIEQSEEEINVLRDVAIVMNYNGLTLQ